MAFRREGYRSSRLSSTNPYHSKQTSRGSHPQAKSASHRSSEPNGPINEFGVYVGNLAWDVTSEILREHMSQAGTIAKCEVLLNFDGRSKGSGIVLYVTQESARRALQDLNDTDLHGRLILVCIFYIYEAKLI
jgi:RNA recognition motif-containing protein